MDKIHAKQTTKNLFYRNDTYRVFTLSVHKTTSTFYVNITIADNVTMVNSENKQVKTWLEREKGESNVSVCVQECIYTRHRVLMYPFSTLCIMMKV